MPNRLPRRTLLAAAPAAALARPALAQERWPARAIRIVVPFAPGGTTDIVARLLGQHLQERLGQPVVVENRPGAGATIGAQIVAQAAPDGYTLLVSNTASNGMSPSLFRSARYDAAEDFTHITMLATTSSALIVHPRFEAQTVTDLVRLGRSRPDGIDFASAGLGTSTHMLALRIGQAGGFRMNPISYRGAGPALTDVIAGTVGFMVDGLPSCIPHIRDGAVKAIATADAQRNRHLPEVPTLIESGFPGLISYSWFGLSGPKGLPAPVVETLNREVRAILALPAMRRRWEELTAEAPEMSPDRYADFIRQDIATWAEVIRKAGVTAE
jgi:tripartite-type tricarboxylate transporter receptor subunit TctC